MNATDSISPPTAATAPSLPAVPPRRRMRRALAAAVPAAVALVVAAVVYSPVWHAGFIWNDSDYVTEPALRSLHGLWRIWFEVGATQQYYPLLHSFFWLEHLAFGDAPLGYHLASVALHAAAACLFAGVLRRLAIPGAWLAAAVFLVHPVCVESVAWVSEQKNTLSTVLYLAAAFAYLGYDADRSRWRYGLALALFVGAVLSKSVVATLPFALLVVLWYRRGALAWRRDVVPLLPWCAVATAGGLFTAWVERTYIGAHGSAFALTLARRTVVAGRAVWFYLGKLLWPADLVFIYPRWNLSVIPAWEYALPLAIPAVLAVLLWRRRRGLLAATLFFIGSLFPVLGFLNVYAFIFSFVADHWDYLPCLGVIALVGAGAATVFARGGRAARIPLATIAVGLLSVLAALSWRQARGYVEVETFYRTILARNPACWMAYNNLAIEESARGHTAEAIRLYEQGLQVKPDDAEAHSNLASALAREGQLARARGEYEAAVRLRPDFPKAHDNLGVVLIRLGRSDEAIAQFATAVRQDPAYAPAHFNLALALLRTRGPVAAARAHLETAVRLDPAFQRARQLLAVLSSPR